MIDLQHGSIGCYSSLGLAQTVYDNFGTRSRSTQHQQLTHQRPADHFLLFVEHAHRRRLHPDLQRRTAP